ncbi:PhoU domain-containing protein [Gayadomonas joobiniege]|uniref:PhoU domain-containing protein n=1 Tax=Gayadomonas joobiniege TaxID=1234606 RepID=UPI0003718679|nr:PhoU domain-containing protein [Gayadomonas joobiniege]
MQLSRAIRDNLKFLVIEVNAQLSHLHTYLDTRVETIAQRILSRSGYSYNLMLRIHNAATRQMSPADPQITLQMNAVSSIASELERITQLARECIQQTSYIESEKSINFSIYLPMIEKIMKSTQVIETSLFNTNTEKALKLAKTERKLDKSYQKIFTKSIKSLKKKKNIQDKVTGLFIAHYLEQMGDCLLNISEAIISSNIGQPMDLNRFQSLKETLQSWSSEQSLGQVEVSQIAETRSGSSISSVRYQDKKNNQQQAIFKDGELSKLNEEFEGVERWHKTYPGIAPQILTYQKSGDNAALLIEHLPGITFEQIVLNAPKSQMNRSIEQLAKTLADIYKTTRQENTITAGFISQTRKRLPDVYAIHPEFRQSSVNIGGLNQPSLETLLIAAETIETDYPAPFSVFIHGDFNLDNIIYNPAVNQIRLIDLHRSCYSDYVQDISVFMVSNYRLQVLDKKTRTRIQNQVLNFYKQIRTVAKEQKDTTFEIRLALGLARSFVTSTRFIMDKTMARNMFLRAQFILAQLVKYQHKDLSTFKLPIEELFCG